MADYMERKMPKPVKGRYHFQDVLIALSAQLVKDKFARQRSQKLSSKGNKSSGKNVIVTFEDQAPEPTLGRQATGMHSILESEPSAEFNLESVVVVDEREADAKGRSVASSKDSLFPTEHCTCTPEKEHYFLEPSTVRVDVTSGPRFDNGDIIIDIDSEHGIDNRVIYVPVRDSELMKNIGSGSAPANEYVTNVKENGGDAAASAIQLSNPGQSSMTINRQSGFKAKENVSKYWTVEGTVKTASGKITTAGDGGGRYDPLTHNLGPTDDQLLSSSFSNIKEQEKKRGPGAGAYICVMYICSAYFL